MWNPIYHLKFMKACRQIQRLFSRNTFSFASEEEIAAQQDRLAKEKYLESSEVRAQVLVTEGWYWVEYFHTFGANDKVTSDGSKLVTSRSNSNTKIYIKRHAPISGGPSAYETLRDSGSNKWISASKSGNSFVDAEGSATWFQVLGVGSHYVFQYLNPSDPTTSQQFGVDNGPIGSTLRLLDSKTELFKLINA